MIDWITSAENAVVVQSGATLISAIVASTTALIVGVFSYPRQRRLDRSVEAARERREIYRQFMQQAGRLDKLIDGSQESLEALGELKAAQFEVALVGSPDVEYFARHLVNQFEKLSLRARKKDHPSPEEFEAFTKEVTSIWLELVNAMRAEFE